MSPGRYLKDPQWKRGDPERDAIEARKARHHGMVDFITAHGGWVVSVPGERQVRVQCLPGSSLPATLIRMGYEPKREQDETRILPVAVTQEFVQSSSGALAVSEGSTKPVSMVTHSSRISPVEVWTFMLP
jgi:hypothetical protein